jgi:hypothetical protein
MSSPKLRLGISHYGMDVGGVVLGVVEAVVVREQGTVGKTSPVELKQLPGESSRRACTRRPPRHDRRIAVQAVIDDGGVGTKETV